jgi:hypothetical protein
LVPFIDLRRMAVYARQVVEAEFGKGQ